jgi:hypothetical protein
MISPFSDAANVRLRALFPDAVGPRIARTVLTKLHEDVHSQCDEEDDETELLALGRHSHALTSIRPLWAPERKSWSSESLKFKG